MGSAAAAATAEVCGSADYAVTVIGRHSGLFRGEKDAEERDFFKIDSFPERPCLKNYK